MLKYIIILSILFTGCVNEIGDGMSSIIAPDDEENGNEEASDEQIGGEGADNEGTDEEESDDKTLVPPDNQLPPGHDQGNLGSGVGGGGTLKLIGCMIQDAPNYNSSATVACTSGCVGGKTGNNCCCED